MDPVAAASQPAERPGHSGFGWRTVVLGIGQTLITLGLVLLLFVGYELWWTGYTTRHDQRVLAKSLQLQWARPAPAKAVKEPRFGSGIAILRIPRLGHKYSFVVVQGTSTADLIKGPGHYPATAMPGQVGNFSVAGHRTTYLHPFYNIDELRVGDPIVIETRTRWFTYRVQNIPGTNAQHQEIVSPSDVAVAYPVPDQPDAALPPTQRVLTLTSCNPRYSAAQRIVVHALLVGSRLKSAGLPVALAGYHLGGG